MHRGPRHGWRGLGTAAAVLAAASLVTACGQSSSSSSKSTTATATKSGSTSGACGTVPQLGYHDQSDVIATLGKGYTSQFNGYATPVYKSDYSNFKFKGKPPYTIGVAVTAPDTPTQAALNPQLQAGLQQIPGVKKVILLTSGPTALTTQLQQVHSLIQQHVDFIVSQPLVSQSFIPVAKAAEAAGIPFISIFNSTPTAASINIAPNSVGDGLVSGALLAKAIGGKGLVVGVHGIPGVGVDTEDFAGWKAAFSRCPGITFDPSVTGDFQPSAAKSAMLSYLSSHPQPIAGVVETAGMASGIIQAFQQADRPVPKFIDAGPSVGELVYFKANPGKLVDAFTLTPSGVVNAARYTIEQLIAGHGPKVSELASLSLGVDSSDLSKYIPAGSSVSDESVLEGPWLPDAYLSRLFS